MGAYVPHMKQNLMEMASGEVWRPELGALGTPVVLWELRACRHNVDIHATCTPNALLR